MLHHASNNIRRPWPDAKEKMRSFRANANPQSWMLLAVTLALRLGLCCSLLCLASALQSRNTNTDFADDVNLPMSLKYHKYLDNAFTDERQCPKPVYIGYFPFAVDVTLTDPKPSSTHRPTEDMKLLLRFEYSMLNAWVLDYLPGMCNDLKLMYRLDEVDTYQLPLCRLLPRGNLSNALRNGMLRYHRSRSLTLSTGYHVVRVDVATIFSLCRNLWRRSRLVDRLRHVQQRDK